MTLIQIINDAISLEEIILLCIFIFVVVGFIYTTLFTEDNDL